MPDKIYFYVEPTNITKDKFVLDKAESHHLSKVLRKKVGNEIWLINGIGSAYLGEIQIIHREVVSGRILEVFPKYGENKINVSLGIGLLKKDKMDFVVEKATENGIHKIYPLNLDKCVKQNINHDRLVKISKSAAKQCGRSIIPHISNPVSLNDLLNTYDNSLVLVCHEMGENGKDILPDLFRSQSEIMVLIGPEGDFSKAETDLLNARKVGFINLGDRRLRSETAAITVLSQFNLYNS